MKRNLVLAGLLATMGTTAVLFTGCNKAAERESVVDTKIAANLMELKTLNEITDDKSQTVYSASGDLDLSALGSSSMKQAKVEGKVQDLINRLSVHKKAVDDQLKDGAIALVVLDDQIKILKVTKDTTCLEAMSLKYMQKLKARCKSSDAAEQSSLQSEISVLKNQSPASLNESFGLIELAAIKIKSYGILDNERTDYGEKKSLLNVSPKPFQFATHVILGDEVGAEDSSADSAASDQAAQ